MIHKLIQKFNPCMNSYHKLFQRYYVQGSCAGWFLPDCEQFDIWYLEMFSTNAPPPSITFCVLRWYQSSTADGECNSLCALVSWTLTCPPLTFLQKSHSMWVNKRHFVLWDKCWRWRGGGEIENVKAAKYFTVKNNWTSFCSYRIFRIFPSPATP